MVEVTLRKNTGTLKGTKNIWVESGIFETLSHAIMHYGDKLKALDFNTKQPLYALYQNAWIDENTGERIPVTKENNFTLSEQLLYNSLKNIPIQRLNEYGLQKLQEFRERELNPQEVEIWINPWSEDETEKYINSSPNYNPEVNQVKENYLVAELLIKNNMEIPDYEITEYRGQGTLNDLIDNIIGWVHFYKGENSEYTEKLKKSDYQLINYNINPPEMKNPFINTHEEFIEKLRKDKKYANQFKPKRTKKQENILLQEEKYIDGQSIIQTFSPIPEEDFINNTGKWKPKELPYKLVKTWSNKHGYYIYIRDYSGTTIIE